MQRSPTESISSPGWIPSGFSRFWTNISVRLDRDQDRAGIWELIKKIPDVDLWRLRRRLKGLLIDEINERARDRWQNKRVHAEGVIAFGALLEPEVFTIGFARRFTGYKRPDLILYDLARLKRLLTNPLQPVQIIFAGKAHPSDLEGARIIQRIFRLAQDPEFGARIAFVEDYDQHLAQRMVRGVDVWLNNPVPPLEASGTSGMKASMNGVPSLSILDGWWTEAYNGKNGWAFGDETAVEGDRSKADADAIYRLLEQEIIPLYYERSDDEIPHGYVQVMKAVIKSIAPQFSTRRMVKEYVNQFLPLDSGCGAAKGLRPTGSSWVLGYRANSAAATRNALRRAPRSACPRRAARRAVTLLSTGRRPAAARVVHADRRAPSRNTYFQNFPVRRRHDGLRMQRAKTSLFENASGKLSLLDAQRDASFSRVPHRQSQLKGRKFRHYLGYRIHAQIKMLGAETVVQIAKHVGPPVHRALPPVGRIESRAQPFEIVALAPVDVHGKIGRLVLRAARVPERA